ncbi:hypothetical protein FQA39_LY18961 [Lamprigera yunnana]|nr:hypothetical protein FQA39_LY18961 [Lamprigera yunnana]
MAVALKERNKMVSIFTTGFDQGKTLENILPLKDSIYEFGDWIPPSVCGYFRKYMTFLRLLWLTIRLILHPQKPTPDLIILDTPSFVLFFLHIFTRYKKFYIHHFPHLRHADLYHQNMLVLSDLPTIKTISYADEILIETKCLQKVFEQSFPQAKKTFLLSPTYETGLWDAKTIDIRRIVPDLPRNHKLFVAFGDYKLSSNFMVILEALEEMTTFTSQNLKEEIHVVIAGNYRRECAGHYDELIQKTKGKIFASQVTFLKQLPTVHKKTLLKACTALIHLVKHDLYPRSIIPAIGMGKPIITVDRGFNSTILTHRISAIFVEADAYKLAVVMTKIANSSTLKTFLGNMARGVYASEFTFKIFGDKLNSLCTKYASGRV